MSGWSQLAWVFTTLAFGCAWVGAYFFALALMALVLGCTVMADIDQEDRW